MITRPRVYRILTILSVSGYGWLFLNLLNLYPGDLPSCLFKLLTGIPCPSCGTTRSLELIIRGEFLRALEINPLGYLACAFLIAIPLWLLADGFNKRLSLYTFYSSAEHFLHKKPIFLTAAGIIFFNWGWNILKSL